MADALVSGFKQLIVKALNPFARRSSSSKTQNLFCSDETNFCAISHGFDL
jgi:hypothetical protein